MKFSAKILLVFSSILIASCGSGEQKKSITTVNNNSTIVGVFTGKIPCASCEAIVYEVQLNENNTYEQSLTYKGESETPIINKGSYVISNDGIIQLNENANTLNYLKKVPKGLLLLDKNGEMIKGALANHYLLTPKETATANKETAGFQQILIKKQQEGIDFYAVGNEPFWSLEIDFDKEIHFKTMNGLDFKAPAIEPNLAQDHNVKRYRSVTESGEIIVQIVQGECSDTMADRKFPYQITVNFKNTTETDYSNFEGCGMYVPDYRLTDIWAIIEVNDTPINASNFQNNLPQIEINSFKQTVFGSDGCNTFRGSIKNEQHNLFIGPMVSTIMACDKNQEVTNAINNTFSKKHLTYAIENNHLIIYNNQEKIMLLKHID